MARQCSAMACSASTDDGSHPLAKHNLAYTHPMPSSFSPTKRTSTRFPGRAETRYFASAAPVRWSRRDSAMTVANSPGTRDVATAAPRALGAAAGDELAELGMPPGSTTVTARSVSSPASASPALPGPGLAASMKASFRPLGLAARGLPDCPTNSTVRLASLSRGSPYQRRLARWRTTHGRRSPQVVRARQVETVSTLSPTSHV